MYTLWDRSTGMSMDFKTEEEAIAQMQEWIKLDEEEYGTADRTKYVIHEKLGADHDN